MTQEAKAFGISSDSPIKVDYTAAYEDALSRCSTDAAPWYVIPANRKWFRNLAIGEILADRIAAVKPAYPIVELPPNLVIS